MGASKHPERLHGPGCPEFGDKPKSGVDQEYADDGQRFYPVSNRQRDATGCSQEEDEHASKLTHKDLKLADSLGRREFIATESCETFLYLRSRESLGSVYV
jgi:hypothetical protein